VHRTISRYKLDADHPGQAGFTGQQYTPCDDDNYHDRGRKEEVTFQPTDGFAIKWPPSEFTEELLPIPRNFLSDYCTKAFTRTGCAEEVDASKYDPESIRKNPTLAIGAAECSRHQ
jgi:hypothetical protein